MESCPFCLEFVQDKEKDDIHYVSCPRCGKYRLTDDAYEELKINVDERQRSNISGWLRDNQGYLITTDSLHNLLKIKTPGFFERTDRILLGMEKQSDYIGHYLEETKAWLTFGWCIDDGELKEMLGYLTGSGMLQQEMSGDGWAYKIAPLGWAHLQELQKVNVDSIQAFVAMAFTDEMFKVYDAAISAGISDAGYRPHLVKMREHNERIDDEIIAQIRRSRFVLSDFTGQRGGVYFESGFAKGLGLEVVWTCRKDDIPNLHFDIRQYNCIDWETNNLPDFRKRISNRIESVLGRGAYRP